MMIGSPIAFEEEADPLSLTIRRMESTGEKDNE
jgi:hypothetical protein